MTDTSFRSSFPYNSFGSVGENTMEALKEFLRDMTKTIEFLCNRYNSAHQTLKSSFFENPDVRTSLSIGMPSVSLRVLPTRDEMTRTHLCGDISGCTVSSHKFQPASNSDRLFPRQRYDEGKLDQMQRWFVQNCSLDERMPGQRSYNFEEGRFIAAIAETEAPNYGNTIRTNSQVHSSDAKDGDALRAFLEDMKETIRAWCARHNLLSQGRPISARRDVGRDGAEVQGTTEATVRVIDRASCPCDKDKDVAVIQVFDLTNQREASCPCDKDKDVAVIQVFDLANQREGERPGFQNKKLAAEAACFIQIQQRNKKDSSSPQVEQAKADGSSFLPHEQIDHQSRQHYHEPPTQMTADAPEQPKAAKAGYSSSSPNDLEESKSDVFHKETDAEITPRNHSVEIDDVVTPKPDLAETKIQAPDCMLEKRTEAINDDTASEMKIQPYKRKVDVVDSPEWLPKGWITEVKTRNSGNSAGSKDKYYFDPVSKRRFRSKKEVFCFLETGKLGRYKSRPKIESVKLLETELPSPGQVIDLSEAKPRKRVRRSSSKSQQQNACTTSGPSADPGVTPPTGLFSNLFMPYRPGQPSDWLVYESLASLPFPVFEHLRYAEYNLGKLSSNRCPPPRPWFLNTPEGSWRPVVDESYLFKSTEKGADVQGLHFGAEAQGFETMPKHSATEARKTIKKSSTSM